MKALLVCRESRHCVYLLRRSFCSVLSHISHFMCIDIVECVEHVWCVSFCVPFDRLRKSVVRTFESIRRCFHFIKTHKMAQFPRLGRRTRDNEARLCLSTTIPLIVLIKKKKNARARPRKWINCSRASEYTFLFVWKICANSVFGVNYAP